MQIDKASPLLYNVYENETQEGRLSMLNLDRLINEINALVERHYLGNGAYARYLWQDEGGSRKMGINEYGCADAMNILYTTGAFPRGERRSACLEALRSLQNPDTGMFTEKTHHPIHTTAHCTAAIELFDEKPLYPPRDMEKYFTKEGLTALLDGLNWRDNPWPQSHQGAGVYVVGALTDSVDLDWQNYYFDTIYEKTDERYGMSRSGTLDGRAPLDHHLYGWFHYMFNMEYGRRPLKYPERLIDTCIELYDEKRLSKTFGKYVGFCEIDWVYALNRATRQTPHRFAEAKDRLRRFAHDFIGYLEDLDFKKDEGLNDLHMLFGAVCALAELQTALPGEIVSTRPLRLVLDRRPFI